jgi:hypothetical protein
MITALDIGPKTKSGGSRDPLFPLAINRRFVFLNLDCGAVMKTYEARMKVVHDELWSVQASCEEEAKKKLEDLHADVSEDETGGEIVDWEIVSIKEIEE